MLQQQLTALSTQIVIITGGEDANCGKVCDGVQVWNPTTNNVFDFPHLIKARASHQQTFYSGKIYVFGGREGAEEGQGGLKSCEVFDPVANAWEPLPDMPCTRQAGEALIYKQKIYLLGGNSSLQAMALHFLVVSLTCNSLM